MLAEAARIRFKMLAELQALVENAIDSRIFEIERTYRAAQANSSRTQDELEEYGEYLAEELHELEDIKREASLLHAVSLYHRLESEVKRIFAWRFSGLSDAQKKSLIWGVHKWKDLLRLTRTYFNFDLMAVAESKSVDVLRRIANAVKHKQGYVTSELHGLTGWPVNQPIEVASIDLKSFRKACVAFISDFAEKAERGMKKRFGIPKKARK